MDLSHISVEQWINVAAYIITAIWVSGRWVQSLNNQTKSLNSFSQQLKDEKADHKAFVVKVEDRWEKADKRAAEQLAQSNAQFQQLFQLISENKLAIQHNSDTKKDKEDKEDK